MVSPWEGDQRCTLPLSFLDLEVWLFIVAFSLVFVFYMSCQVQVLFRHLFDIYSLPFSLCRLI
ncbi:unnamed protein product, partial [Thlaspi arvense]